MFSGSKKQKPNAENAKNGVALRSPARWNEAREVLEDGGLGLTEWDWNCRAEEDWKSGYDMGLLRG